MAEKPKPTPETVPPSGFGCKVFDINNPTEEEKANHPHLFPDDQSKEESK